MRGMCVWLREISPGEREMVTSGGEREERQAWTHDNIYIYSVDSNIEKYVYVHIQKSLSQTFSLTVPIWWNDLPNSNQSS